MTWNWIMTWNWGTISALVAGMLGVGGCLRAARRNRHPGFWLLAAFLIAAGAVLMIVKQPHLH